MMIQDNKRLNMNIFGISISKIYGFLLLKSYFRPMMFIIFAPCGKKRMESRWREDNLWTWDALLWDSDIVWPPILIHFVTCFRDKFLLTTTKLELSYVVAQKSNTTVNRHPHHTIHRQIYILWFIVSNKKTEKTIPENLTKSSINIFIHVFSICLFKG